MVISITSSYIFSILEKTPPPSSFRKSSFSLSASRGWLFLSIPVRMELNFFFFFLVAFFVGSGDRGFVVSSLGSPVFSFVRFFGDASVDSSSSWRRFLGLTAVGFFFSWWLRQQLEQHPFVADDPKNPHPILQGFAVMFVSVLVVVSLVLFVLMVLVCDSQSGLRVWSSAVVMRGVLGESTRYWLNVLFQSSYSI